MQNGAKIDWEVYEKSEMALKQFIIDSDSVFLGKTIRESGIRDKYHCMIAGVESEDGTLMVPDVNAPLEEGDVVWVVGEKDTNNYPHYVVIRTKYSLFIFISPCFGHR